ncbi:MAG: hypothetical protein WCK82_08500 [Bacteroidota bacterium]|jgi:hypothetical protein
MEKEKFIELTQKYGHWSSWAIWTGQGEKPKSNIGDLSIFKDENVFKWLKPNIIFVGLNISRGAIKEPLANFHDKRKEATDFKIRYALLGTPLWGAYMTDLIKDYDEKHSGKVIQYLRTNEALVLNNVQILDQELIDLGQKDYKLIAFGRDVYSMLRKYYKDRYEIFQVPHYASYSSKEKYRDLVKLEIDLMIKSQK